MLASQDGSKQRWLLQRAILHGDPELAWAKFPEKLLIQGRGMKNSLVEELENPPKFEDHNGQCYSVLKDLGSGGEICCPVYFVFLSLNRDKLEIWQPTLQNPYTYRQKTPMLHAVQLNGDFAKHLPLKPQQIISGEWKAVTSVNINSFQEIHLPK